MRRERRPSFFLRGLLLFVLGALVGANATYFVMTRGSAAAQPAPARKPAPTEGERIETPLPISGTTPAATPTQAPAPTANVSAADPMPAVSASPASAGTGDALLLPVQGVSAAQLQDTFTDARSNGRVHDAIDIMAPAGTPVLAVADGTVEKLFDSKLGGTTLYQFNGDRTLAYYYAHLQGYAPGIAEKQALKRGQPIGYVGATGNASPDAPHLHFAVFRLGPEQQWWKGTAINPYPLLRGAQ